MYTCPACGSVETSGKSTCRCGADLSLLQCIDVVADAWFNEGLDALARNETGKALEWMAACCTARPSDAAARRALGKIWAQLGHAHEARRCLDLSAENDPDHPDVAEVRAALDEIENSRKLVEASAAPGVGKKVKTGRRQGKRRLKRARGRK